VHFLDRQIILISGKGGVGRTAVASAMGRAAAKAKRRTLVLEIGYEEGARSALGAQFGRPDLKADVLEVDQNLSIGRLNARTGHAEFLRTILPSKTLIAAALRSRAVQKFLVAAPSLHEMGLFYHLLDLKRRVRSDGTPQFELLIVDMPATGHTLALTGLPQILLRLIPRGPIARALVEGQALLNDPKRGEAWVVSLPEKLPVSEACELVDGLRETNVSVGGIILNRMPEDPFSDSERAALGAYLEKSSYFGQLSLDRIDAARAAQIDLTARLSIPVLVFPDVHKASDLTKTLTQDMGRYMGVEP
jgi:anion-transporting  ArsA/GET3 family ATPase